MAMADVPGLLKRTVVDIEEIRLAGIGPLYDLVQMFSGGFKTGPVQFGALPAV